MKGAIVHGALLAVMLVFGYKTWTKEKTETPAVTTGDVVLWNKSESELVALEYAAPKRTVKIERRGEGANSYWWGVETKETPPPPPPTPPAPPKPPGAGGGSGSAAMPPGPHAPGPRPPGAPGATPPKPGAGSAATPAPKPPGTPTPTPKTPGGTSGPKPPATSPPKTPASTTPKPPATTTPKKPAPAPAPGPAKMGDPDQPGGGGGGSGSAKGSAAKKAPPPKTPTPKTPAAGSGSAATPKAPTPKAPAPKTPTPGAGSGSGAATSSPPGGDTSTSSPADPLGAAAEPETPQPITQTREFPVGEAADKLIKGYTAARAVRDLGKIDEAAKKDYKLDDTSVTLSIVFKSGTRSFVIGGPVPGGSGDRYAQDPDSGKVYVLAGAVITPFEQGESSLRLTDPRGFDATKIEKVAIAARGKTRDASRMMTDAPVKPDPENPHGPPPAGGKTKTWGDPKTGKPDQTLANFIDNADRLKPTKYEATLDPGKMTEVVTITYFDAKGGKLGTARLLKRDKPPEPTPGPTPTPPGPTVEYYIVTEKTHNVPGLVPKSMAERIEQDIGTVFGS